MVLQTPRPGLHLPGRGWILCHEKPFNLLGFNAFYDGVGHDCIDSMVMGGASKMDTKSKE